MDWKKLMNNKSTIYYSIAILFFGLITLWIVKFNNHMNMIETCVVRYAIGLFVLISLHYNICVRKIKINMKKVCRYVLLVTADCLVSYCLVSLLKRIGKLDTFSNRYFLLFFVIGILLYMIVSYIMKSNNYENVLFTGVIFFVGTLYAYSYPITTGISWDDQIHFARTMQISQLGDTNFSLADHEVIANAFNGGGARLFEEDQCGDFLNEVTSLYNKGDKAEFTFEKMPIRLMISYLPSAIMIIIGRGLSLSYKWLVIFGRWGNVIFYASVIYVALSKLKSGKWIIFVLSMLPTTLFLMSNYSYDTYGVALSILALSHYIGILQDNERKMSYKDILLISVLFLFAFSVKSIYFCMALVPLTLPKEKLDDKCNIKLYRSIVIATALIIMLSFALPFLVSGTGGNDMRGGADVNSVEQIKFILTNPIKYTQILLNFLWNYWAPRNSFDYTNSFAYLGGNTNVMPIVILSMLFILLDKDKVDIKVTNLLSRIWTLLLVFVSSAFVATSLYVAYTAVGSEKIAGCTARYLLPLMFFVCYYIGDYRLIAKVDKYINRKMMTTVMVLVYSSYSIFMLYRYCLSLY